MPDTPDRYEQVFVMKYMEGKTWGQIAKALDIPPTSLDRIKRRIRKDLYIMLQMIKLVRQGYLKTPYGWQG